MVGYVTVRMLRWRWIFVPDGRNLRNLEPSTAGNRRTVSGTGLDRLTEFNASRAIRSPWPKEISGAFPQPYNGATGSGEANNGLVWSETHPPESIPEKSMGLPVVL